MGPPRLSLALLLPCAAVLAAGEDPSITFFRDLAETRNYTLGQPVSPRPTPDGAAVIFLRGGPRDPVLRLYELDIATRREREIITPAQLLGGAAEVLSPEEKAHRERTRNTLRGFTDFDLSRDGSRLLVTLSGKLYVLNRADLRVTALPGEDWIAPHLSPDGAFVAAVRSGELHVIDLATLADRALTTGGSATLSHGAAEFIAQEEMSRDDGYWWSPDSLWIAYQETDESAVEARYIADPLHPEAAPRKYSYPRAGSANARVRLGVISRDGGATRWIPRDAEKYPYLARVEWREAGAPLTLVVEDRRQQDERVLAADPSTSTVRELLAETDPAWVNLVEPNIPHWLKGGRQFLWTTERRGFWQLELRDASGALVRELTPPDLGYRDLVGADEAGGFVFVLASKDPTETQLWRFPLASGAGQPLTSSRGVHGAVLSDDGRTLVHAFSLLDATSGVEVLSSSGARLASLVSVAESPKALPRVDLVRTGGERSYCAALVRPRRDHPGRRYPVILSVYAGPQTTHVTASARAYFIDQWMADQGYVVARLDGRGTTLRGRDWQRLMRGNFIDLALHDQVEGLQALGAQNPEMDLARVGVVGWSFGGYFSAMAVIRRPDVFRAGVAGAPVVTWENYDTYYTERYIGLPQENPQGYRASSVLTYAGQLSRPLLLIHGLTDDNVYFQHSVQLADALFLAGKPYEFMPMLGTHMAGADSSVVRLREEQRIMEFFNRTLR
ncbi:MAG TPA: DPP IV N-terminal domain-containing protein [Opitutaceae bacterium]|nr:DPP IV N-terminal domain-containing protein [Opitutaceae bacterium]